MNGGAPPATPLRALRRPPTLIDDVAVAPPLASAVDRIQPTAPLDPAELVRWTRAWLVSWQGVYLDRGVVGVTAPDAVPLPLDALPRLKGDPEGHRHRDALALLERAGVATLSADRRTVTLTAVATIEHRAGLELDWSGIGRAVRYEPAPLLVARAIADHLPAPAEPTPITLRELAERTGYAAKQVRIALRRLIDPGVLLVRETAGMPLEYCFGTVALRGTASAAAERTPALVRPAPPSAPAYPAPAPSRSVALRLTLNGVTLTLGPGLAPHVELDADGVPHLSFDRISAPPS